MLKVHTNEDTKALDPVKYFNESLDYFDFRREEKISKESGFDYVGNKRFMSHMGILKATELPGYVKLAWCLSQAPFEFFSADCCSTQDLEKILLADSGNLVMPTNSVFPYTFPVNVEVLGFGHIITSTQLSFALRRCDK